MEVQPEEQVAEKGEAETDDEQNEETEFFAGCSMHLHECNSKCTKNVISRTGLFSVCPRKYWIINGNCGIFSEKL